MLDDGQTLREGPVIVQYLADQVPDKGLIGPVGQHGTLPRPGNGSSVIGTELPFPRPLFKPSTPEDSKPAVKQHLLERFAWVNEQLAGKDSPLGDTFSVADAYLFTVSNWGKFVGVDLSGLAHLQAYAARVAARPAVQAALKEEGLLPK